MKKLVLMGIIALIGFTVVSCGKYEDGPSVSLLTKKQRLTGDWKLEKYTVDGTDYTTQMQQAIGTNFVWQIEKDGNYHMTGNGTENGNWAFGEDKDDVTFTPTSGSATTYRILELKNKQIELRYTAANGQLEVWTLNQ